MRVIFLLLLSMGAVAQTADDYQISGTVVDHLTNRPLNHVLVEIISNDKDGGESSVLTGADGQFTFVHVPAGKYKLQAQKRGQPPQAFHASDGGFGTAIVVDGKQKTDQIVFALRTDSSISGVVLGDDGEPVRNAHIHLFHEAVRNGEVQTVTGTATGRDVATNSSGQFHFGHLEAGKYYLAASGTPWYSSQPGAENVYPVTFYGDTTDATAARAIILAEGSAASAQIELHLVPAIRVKLPGMKQGFMLFVPGPGSAQIPVNSSVMASDLGGQLTFSSHGNIQQVDKAHPNANLELGNIAAGRYEVSTFDGNGDQGEVLQTVDLANGSTLSLDAASGVASISGRIVFDTPHPAKEGLNLFLGSGRRGGMRAAVAADGTFQFERASTGKFNVNLGSSSLVITTLEAKGARVVHDQLEVSSGAAVDLTIHVQSSESLAALSGFAVQGESGVPGAMVLLLPQDLSRGRLIRRDQSDSDGSFTLSGIQPGHYTLVAIDDGHDLVYKDEKVIKPYLEGGLVVTIPLKSSEVLKVTVQTRKP